MAAPSHSTLPVPVAPMQSSSQADATAKDIKARMGEDVGLLSYLPCEKVRTAPFNNKGESGHPLPIRILFGRIKHEKPGFREVWALLHNKPGSSRPPEVRLKLFTLKGELKGPITLEDAMEQALPAAAFTCSKAQNNGFDRAHLSAIIRYYFILQKVQLPSPWPISDVFVSELKSACKVAKANAEGNLHQSRSTATSKGPEPTMLPQAISDGAYTTSHRAIKSSRAASVSLNRAASTNANGKGKKQVIVQSTSITTKNDKEDLKPNLAELLIGESADASLLSSHESTLLRVSSSRGPESTPAKPSHEPAITSPGKLVASIRQNLAENEARDRRLTENRSRQVELEAELEDLEEEAIILRTAMSQSKVERKRLRASLSSRDLAFIQLGQDITQGGGKRLRFDESDEE